MFNRKTLSALALSAVGSISVAHAASLNFLDDTANTIIDALDSAAIVLVAIAIIVVALSMLFGRMGVEMAIKVILGAAVFGAAIDIATVLLGK